MSEDGRRQRKQSFGIVWTLFDSAVFGKASFHPSKLLDTWTIFERIRGEKAFQDIRGRCRSQVFSVKYFPVISV
ncbi:hypothetical protein [Rhizobium mayense]|uniref:Uncharacterized protein n=1 Tax=Rhizobium mayense TaxID=1312184 RepID=A0ABT7JTM2_9HYPH|nr:hypothetical protein [Rhizobium mayense]MDL2399702.1 hypothetical protein [Rhizobium mayense]